MARHARVSLAAGDTKTALLAALEAPPAGGSSIRCYGTSTGLSRPLPKESPAYYDGEALSAQRPGRGAGGVLSMAWKAAAGVGVLVLAATLITSAASKMGSTFEEAVNLTEKRAGSPAETIQALTIQASNEYGVFNKAALDLYGLEMIIEPYRETTLTVKGLDSSIRSKRFVWRLQHASKHGVTSETPGDAWSHTGGPQAVVTADRPGTLYQVTVQAIDGEGGVIAEGKAKASCKYVRREIRDLTEADREAFFNAMQVWYTVPTEVGQARYGSDFSNYQRITAYHNTDAENFCYHQGMQFLTSHVTFMFVVERYLQMIDPRVSLPIWDYMIEALTLGDEWYNSVIFSPDWFGDAMGKEENSFMVSEGRFGNVSTIYDPDHTLVDDRIVPSYNPYGYMTSVSNYQDLPRLTRTSSYCGLSSKATFATPEVFVACFEDYNTFYDWEQCMQLQIHGDLHGMLGGAFNCNTDMKQFAQDHPEYSHSLLAFTLQQVTFKYGACNALTPNDNACDTECEKGQTEPCGCTCLIDAFSISDEQVYAYMEDFMETATLDFTGDVFISYDEGAQFPYGFMQGGERMSHEETFFLMRTLVKIGCEPGAVGQMATAAAPNDPIFHVLHPIFEKALHILLLSPKYRDTYTFEWIDGSCPGSGYKEELPFTEKLLGIGTGTAFLTNERLLELMDPTNPEMPYVFTDFSRWGNTETDLI